MPLNISPAAVTIGGTVIFLLIGWLAIVNKTRKGDKFINGWDLVTSDNGRLQSAKVIQFTVFVCCIGQFLNWSWGGGVTEGVLVLFFSVGVGQAIATKVWASAAPVLPQQPPSVSATVTPDGNGNTEVKVNVGQGPGNGA